MENVIKTAKRLIKLYETRDPFIIAKYEGFKVVFGDFEEIKGYQCKILRRKYIMINQNLDWISRHVVCGHELGHGMLHDIAETCFMKEYTLLPVHSRTEMEANLFVAELVVDDNFEIHPLWDDGISLDNEVFQKLIELKKMYGG